MKRWSKQENIQALLGFVGFSIAIILLGWMLGVYDHDVREEGWTEVIHHSPSEEPRF